MTNMYCASCDRLNHKKAAFCGSCGQSLAIVGSHLERFSFPLWSILIALSLGFLPTTLLLVMLGDTYWAIEAYELLESDAPFSLTSMLIGSCLFYSAFYIWVMRQFPTRRIMYWLNYVQLVSAAIGILISGSLLVQMIRRHIPVHEVLQQLSTKELTQIHNYVLAHYIAFLLFYSWLFLYTLRVAVQTRRAHQKARFGE